MKTVQDIMKENNSEYKMKMFIAKQRLPYEMKVKHAEIRAKEFVAECDKRNLNYHVSVGGLDSITLLVFLRSIGINCPAISASVLEDVSIQRVHRELGVEAVKPVRDKSGRPYTQIRVLQEFGFPILSKEKAAKIELLQNPTEKK